MSDLGIEIQVKKAGQLYDPEDFSKLLLLANLYSDKKQIECWGKINKLYRQGARMVVNSNKSPEIALDINEKICLIDNYE